MFSDHCIYTIVGAQRLAAGSRNKSPQFTERRQWVTGHALWRKAVREKRRMPIVFADAADCSRLLYWALLTKIQLRGALTAYDVDRIRKLRGKYAPQDLVLRSTGKNIAARFIRPYAICITPSFLRTSRA